MSVELISVYAVNFRKCRNQSSISFCLAPRQNDKISPIRATSRGPCPLIKTKSTSSLCKAAFCEVKSSKLFLTLLDRVSVPCGLLFCFCCRWNQEGDEMSISSRLRVLRTTCSQQSDSNNCHASYKFRLQIKLVKLGKFCWRFLETNTSTVALCWCSFMNHLENFIKGSRFDLRPRRATVISLKVSPILHMSSSALKCLKN